MAPKPRAGRDSAVPPATDRRSLEEQAVVGVVGEADATRAGEDTRRRGWFWHWNTIVTQYAPLIGLKGVGLLNSYTVWTDRREDSPNRGYAFPSQQSEADFYGEDRAELITINKILVALDLIEIRKEMVLRTDEKGRRWKVPHNFYRVKDNSDRHTLTAHDVMRVVQLADRDAGVYRYVRRIFSDRFSPIDRDNIWYEILAEISTTEVWQRLAARTAREESRASARTKAGHAARKAGFATPVDGDTATRNDTINDSDTDSDVVAAETSVANTNNGLSVDVAPANNGSRRRSKRDVAPTNTGGPTVVAPTNTTYHQYQTTTTTGENEQKSNVIVEANDVSRTVGGVAPEPLTTVAQPVTAAVTAGPAPGSAGPGGMPAPANKAGEAAAVRAFEDANGRTASAAERHLLRALAERFEPAARAVNDSGRPTGWDWVAAAVYDAVEAGSSFVAPRRLREILQRWEREGLPGSAPAQPSQQEQPAARRSARSGAAAEIPLGDGPDVTLPHGYGSRQTWAFAVGLLGAVIERERLMELVAGSAIVGYLDGEVSIAAASAAQADRLAGEYRDLVTRKLSEALRRPVRITVIAPRGTPPGGRPPIDEPLTVPVFTVPECGLSNTQLWTAVLDEVETAGRVGRAGIDGWLRQVQVIGRGPAGQFVLGAPHTLAQRRIESRYLGDVRSALTRLVGRDFGAVVVVAAEWLASQSSPDIEADLAG